MEKKARVIAMYLPQYHPIPLNDEWWGPGFTEWTNVVQAKPLYKGHKQPRVPSDLGFYDLRLSESREAQVELAREAGIEGFMYWHYWFGNGKRLLERPFNEVLKSGKPDFPFCLGWANHTWATRTWTAHNKNGAKGKVIMQQEYPGLEDYTNHFMTLLPAFKDHRYITVEEKPLFLIYNVLDIPNFKLFIETWQKLANENGLKGIHFVGNIMGHMAEQRCEEIMKSGVNATATAFLNQAELAAIGKVRYYLNKAKTRIFGAGPEVYNYKDIVKHMHTKYDKQEDIYPVVYPQLDRTPRSGKSAIIFKNATPEIFEQYLKEKVELVKGKSYAHKIIFLNAWNEWGEGNYVEPDIINGRGFLDAIKNAIISVTS